MRIWAWGANSNGQLGLGFTSEQEPRPTEVPYAQALPNTLRGIKVAPVDVCGGASHTMVLADFHLPPDPDGTMPTPPETVKITEHLEILRFPRVECVAAGFDFSFYLFGSGQLNSFGENWYSQLGRKISEAELISQGQVKKTTTKKWGGLDYGRFSELHLDIPFFEMVSAGMRHAAAISVDQELYVWGDNTKYQLGIYRVSANGHEEFTYRVDIPAKVHFPQGYRFTKVACGKDFVIAVHESGCLFGCGQNRNGVLLHAPQDISVFYKFTHIYDLLSRDFSIVDIRCGWSHVLVLLSCGKVISWGRNDLGQLGRTSVNPNFDVEPHFIDLPEEIVAIRCGSEHNLALTRSGKVYAWGWNEHDNCGVRSTETNTSSIQQGAEKTEDYPSLCLRKDCVRVPTLVEFPDDVKIAVIGCGAGSSFALAE